MSLDAAWFDALPLAYRHLLIRALSPRLNAYIPHRDDCYDRPAHDPTPPQASFLLLGHREALYGGAVGGGKTDALLMAALQYVDVPGYAALLVRRTYKQLALPKCLIPRSHEWLRPTPARWNGENMRWTFPSGAVLHFGHIQHPDDRFNYQSAEYQFIGFDELTQFELVQYTYLTTRLRRLEGSKIPLRMRAGSNPDGIGRDWVKMRFPIIPESEQHPDRAFVPAKLRDNPHLDRVEYEATLADLDPVTRSQLLDGDWTARRPGGYFKREDFAILDQLPAGIDLVRYWDLAATEDPSGDPDYCSGCLGGEHEGRFVIGDIQRFRADPVDVERRIVQTAALDGPEVTIVIEQEPGASGKIVIDNYRRHALRGYTVQGDRPTGDKEVRARPLSSATDAGNVLLVRGRWVPAFLDEAEAFGMGGHDDMIDSTSGCFSRTMIRTGMTMAETLAIMSGEYTKGDEGGGDAAINV